MLSRLFLRYVQRLFVDRDFYRSTSSKEAKYIDKNFEPMYTGLIYIFSVFLIVGSHIIIIVHILKNSNFIQD